MPNFLTEIKIGSVNVYPNIAVAPLAGYTDFPYRSRTGDNWTYLVFRAPSS